jgi:hypothetical protein
VGRGRIVFGTNTHHASIGITSEASTGQSHHFSIFLSLLRQVGCRVVVQGSSQTRPGSGVIEGRTQDGARCDVRYESLTKPCERRVRGHRACLARGWWAHECGVVADTTRAGDSRLACLRSC